MADAAEGAASAPAALGSSPYGSSCPGPPINPWAQKSGGRSKASSVPTLPAVQLPGWKQKALNKTKAANSQAALLVKQSHEREEAARQRLQKMRAQAQRQLARAQSEAALMAKVEENRRKVSHVKAESKALAGLDVTARIANLPAPTEEEVLELSRMFNGQLAKHFGPEERSFYKLFKSMDLDGSQRISFNEVETLARGPLHLSLKQLPPARLDLLWKALDHDGSGYIDAGELSRFTKLGKPKELSAAQVARLKLQAENWKQKALVRATTDAKLAKHIIAKQLMVCREPATPRHWESD